MNTIEEGLRLYVDLLVNERPTWRKLWRDLLALLRGS